MLYLTVIVILPSKKELAMEIDINPIMCSTVNVVNVNRLVNKDGTPVKCEWASCREWCLSKDSNMCTQITARPRERGPSFYVEDCEIDEVIEDCSALDVEATVPLRCKKGDCRGMDGLYDCDKEKLNECKLLVPAYTCVSNNISHETIICDEGFYYEEGCKKRLDGVVFCELGECINLYDFDNYTQCNRSCTELKIMDYNTIIFTTDQIIAKKCNTIYAANGTEEVEALSDNPRWVKNEEILMMFCTYVESIDYGFKLDDCFNGTLGSYDKVAGIRDYRDFLNIHYETGETEGWVIPIEDQLTLNNDTRLYINSEKCSNTLSKVCTKFYKEHTKDQSDGRTRDRYPCYRTLQNNNEFVTAFFDPDTTYVQLMVAIFLPASIFIFSCGSLYLCSRVVQTDEEGHLKLKQLKKKDMGGSGDLWPF